MSFFVLLTRKTQKGQGQKRTKKDKKGQKRTKRDKKGQKRTKSVKFLLSPCSTTYLTSQPRLTAGSVDDGRPCVVFASSQCHLSVILRCLVSS